MPTAGRTAPFDLAQTHFADETVLVRRLVPLARLSTDENTVLQRYAPLIAEQLRAQRRHDKGIDALLSGFPLDTPAGRSLLTLAEALPRIPDDATADRLIADLLHATDWKGMAADSAVVRLARWTLEHARSWSEHNRTEPLVRLGLRKAIRELGRHFVIADRIDDALARRNPAFAYSFDMLAEAAQTQTDAEQNDAAYRNALLALAADGATEKSGISVKLSALHPRYEPRQAGRVREELWPRLLALMQLARQHEIPVTVDAEESERLTLALQLFEHLLAEPTLAGWCGLGIAVQAYQKRALAQTDWLIDAARSHQRRITIRLVKGAYWDSEIRQTQREGWRDYPVFTRKSHTDTCYLACARRMLDADDVIQSQFATHNVYTALAVHAMAAGRNFEFQCLYGLGEALYSLLPGHGLSQRCRIYAPVGNDTALQPYLIRRLLENGANSAFVQQQLADDDVHPRVADPVADAQAHPDAGLPPPLGRADAGPVAPGVCWGNEVEVVQQAQALATGDECTVTSTHPAGNATRSGRPVFAPARPDICLGHIIEASDADIDVALARAAAIAPIWGKEAASERAVRLETFADALLECRVQLLSLLVREAGMPLADAVDEWRAAATFCLQHAGQAETATPLGPIAVLGPSSSPLAGLVAQASAALAAGNPVLLKPAAATTLIAAAVVTAAHASGLDRDVLQLLPGDATVGARLVADPRIAAVVLSGTAATAHAVHRALARQQQLKRLIAHSAGLNALIADTSTQAEQLVRDTLNGAFSHAGQRGTALRLLCLPQATAPVLIPRLHAAMAELRLGDPASICTDIGPLISINAAERLQAAKAALHRAGYPDVEHGIVDDFLPPTLAAPTLIEIDRPDALHPGLSGPVLAVLRYAPAQLPALLAALDTCINGGSLTIHSRCPGFIASVTARVRADTVYVNRPPAGADVGMALRPAFLTREGNTHQPGVVDPLIGQLADTLRELARHENTGDENALLALIDEIASRSPIGRTQPLPSPTGERRTRHYRSRGLIACLGQELTSLRQQLITVVLTGNTAVLPGHEAMNQWQTRLAEHCRLVPDPLALPIAACLCATPPTVAFKQHLAQRGNAIVDIVLPMPDGRYPLHRLVSETAVWENTATCGGDADLLDDDT
ncbi:bifunctional proline dehydrogenase/L-glutamate gamma-semialdehyde dehydrogenase PutA [Jeongeupia chitinilytica]|uniref:Bifunctional protein PutA n=1 Tax=Jeongeupia chitinilytica TaxID=1041641 RepID=A0ABQ3H1R2_9NEIS|nr:bifunctional proline dehydrogenase/L-glutamate gamma-semialdehyde dehydrogenase PutA [Jeongeupia chitinilytica]GHD63548.1 bifunctional protein PutA [Jeongeupia chitinilytica]